MKLTYRYPVILFVLVLLFALPGISALFLFAHPQWLPAGNTNKGHLLQPSVFLHMPVQDKKWQLLFWAPDGCETQCLTQLDKLARVRLALGRRLYHVHVTLLRPAKSQLLSATTLQFLKERTISSIDLSFDESTQLLHMAANAALFIANPDGYLVLSYAADAEADDVFHDIKQLLTVKES
jgi:hypothetical protein